MLVLCTVSSGIGWHEGSEFPDQGETRAPALEVQRLSHWTPGKALLVVFVIIIMAGGSGNRIWNMIELTKDQYEMRVTVWLVP